MPAKRISIVFIAAVVFISCDNGAEGDKQSSFSPSREPPPFVITRPVNEIYERSGYFKYAGIVFYFMNTTNKEVDEITASFMLFDAETKTNPFIGSNKFEITKLDLLLPNENKEIIISLDKYIHIAPNQPYLIDFFYISRLHYTDGSIWEDKYGLYGIN